MSVEDQIHRFLGAYMGSPQWVKSLVGRAYSYLPVRIMRGPRYVQFQRQLAARDPEVIAALCQEKLRETLKWAIETVPAYRGYRKLLGALDTPTVVLQHLPIVSKLQIKNDLERYLSIRMPQRARFPAFTGGSTENPMAFFLEKGVSRPREYAFMDAFHARVEYGGSDVVLSLRGRTVPTAKSEGDRLWMYEPIKRQLILSSDHLERRYMTEYMAAMRKWKPRYIQAFPSALYPLARWLMEHPEPEVTTRLRGVMLYSENVYDFQMRLFRQVFGCPVLKHYGHSERVLMAATVPDDERYFFWPQYGHFELLDDADRAIDQPGLLGEIVGTSFDNRVMPFVRYRTGDMAMLSERPHPAFPGYPVVERIEGRMQEFLVTRDHRLISICTMGAAHFEQLASVQSIQYEQNEPGCFQLKVVTHKPLLASEKEEIAHAVKVKTQGGCIVEVVEVAELPRTERGKHRMLIQNLNVSSHFGAATVE